MRCQCLCHGPGAHGPGPHGPGPHGLGAHGPGPQGPGAIGARRKSCAELGEAPAELAEWSPHRASLHAAVSEAAVPRGPVCVLGGHQCSAGGDVWGPREPACSRAPLSPERRQRGDPPGLQGVRGRGSHRRGKPMGTDPWLPGHTGLRRPQSAGWLRSPVPGAAFPLQSFGDKKKGFLNCSAVRSTGRTGLW